MRSVPRRVVAVLAWVLVLAVSGCTAPGPDDAGTTLPLVAVDLPAVVDAASVGLADVSTDVADAGGALAVSALTAFPQLHEAALDAVGIGGEESRVDVVAADRQVLGVSVRAPGPRDGSEVLYADVASGATWSAHDLLSPDSVRVLEDAVRTVLEEDGETVDDGDLVRDVRFARDGALIVVSADGTRAWTPAGTPAEAEIELSDAGRLVRGAARQGGAFVGAVVTQSPATGAPGLPLPPPPSPPLPPPDGTPPPVDCGVVACVALTFDDGPGSDTPRLLDLLAQKGVPATFYMVGNRVAANPATAKAIADAGHALGNHTWNHPDLTKADDATRTAEIDRTTQAIVEATGKRPTTMRPPYGAINDDVRRQLAAAGLPAVLWDVDTMDWKSKDALAVQKVVSEKVRPGSVVLMHDIHATTVDAVGPIIDELRAAGYTFVTADQLFGPMEPGRSYFRR